MQIEAGRVSLQYHDNNVCDVKAARIECDEIRAFCYARRNNVSSNGLHQGTSQTSHMERHKQSMRMRMRRYTRRTNGFSKRLDRHVYSLANLMLYYNFIRPHQTLDIPPPFT